MFERIQSFDMNGKECTGIQIQIENILQNKLKFSTDSIKLGESLLRINYFDEKMDQEKQKSNRITILQEPEKKVYIQVKGQLSDEQVENIWQELKKDLKITVKHEEKKDNIPSKGEIINNIIELIKLKGYSINNNDAYNFLDNFQAKYNRLPINQEVDSIVKGYILMRNEEYLREMTEMPIKKDNFSEIGESFMERGEIKSLSDSYSSTTLVSKNSAGRRKCPSCGDLTSIHEVTDKTQIILDYPRIYGKKKYCGICGFEWKN